MLTRAGGPIHGSTETGLFDACRRGDIAAFETLYSLHAARMKSIAFHLLRHRADSEDAVQNTFLRIYRAIPEFTGASIFEAWMYRILINCCYDTGRQRQRQAECELTTEHSIEHASGGDVSLQIALARALERIHSGHRMVFWLFEVEGFKHSEVAGILEIPEGTSRKWLFEAKRELKNILTEGQ